MLVFNTTTLIVLRELGYSKLADRIRVQSIAKIVIPQCVREEFKRAGTPIGVSSDDTLVEHTDTSSLPLDVPRSLGEGERQAIAIAYTLAKSQGKTAIVVTDDKKARSLCKRIGVKVLGTLGLIEFAKKHGAITKEEALSLLEKIPQTSLYITKELLDETRTKIKNQ